MRMLQPQNPQKRALLQLDIADAGILQTGMHSHYEVDVISVMVAGRIAHEGSLEHGQSLSTNTVQVQRAGGAGFSHNEVNPDNSWNRMIQLWVLPEISGQRAKYSLYQPVAGELTPIYGGEDNGGTDFPAHTKIDVAILNGGQQIVVNEPFIAYITRGKGTLNKEKVEDGDLVRGELIKFTAAEDAQLIVVHSE